MYRLIETIRIENGAPSLLIFHQERMDRARRELYGLKESCSLFDHLSSVSLPQQGIWKCRITYSSVIDNTEFEPYQKKSIQTLQIVEANDISYDHKFANRDEINRLFGKRKNADDILIIRNNRLTDTSYCNIALWDGKKWVTPLHPILKGVSRESLIRQEKIVVQDILTKDLPQFQTIKLFNAMITFEEANEVSIASIQF